VTPQPENPKNKKTPKDKTDGREKNAD
jgi:hypothetical protein